MGNLEQESLRLEKSGRLHWIHWMVVAASLVLSVQASATHKEITPRDLYPEVSGIISDLSIIRANRRVQTSINAQPLNPNTSPTDNYHLAYLLLEKVIHLSRLSDNKPLSLPTRLTVRPLPADTLPLLVLIRQALSSIIQAYGIEQETFFYSANPGLTPPDVNRQLRKAVALMDTLINEH